MAPTRTNAVLGRSSTDHFQFHSEDGIRSDSIFSKSDEPLSKTEDMPSQLHATNAGKNEAPGLRKLLEQSTRDTKLIFSESGELMVHMDVLRANAGYFASHASFQTIQQDGVTKPTHTVDIRQIATNEEVAMRYVLFFYTHKASDLCFTAEAAFQYFALEDFLELEPGVIRKVRAHTSEYLARDYDVKDVKHMLTSACTTPIGPDLVCSIFDSLVDEGRRSADCGRGDCGAITRQIQCRECPQTTTICRICRGCEIHCLAGRLRGAMAIPPIWLVSAASFHTIPYDIVDICARLKEKLGEQYQEISSSFHAWVAEECAPRDSLLTMFIEASKILYC
ncbi:uncharacterized protein EV422DRAFT_373740 [Fimicolochytrium jonesii]|uniref:uncharacterized protein n=1 Tax=Fimicolochytrium jonesii TaxID=1396493 RepID=UPI0022FF2A9F|nr:uncharacterized protein EV422DRAFT_373740 [Fimicolochytrium jonesii]KAI8815518.1 hypothetical protein EV422DRAFT_373740 [Fimicolochytrium jonesii]